MNQFCSRVKFTVQGDWYFLFKSPEGPDCRSSINKSRRYCRVVQLSLSHILVVGIFAGLLLWGGAACAMNFFVSNTNDGVDGDTLRAAVIAANQIGGENRIVLLHSERLGKNGMKSQQVFHLTISGPFEDQAQTGDLDITRGRLTILAMDSNVTIDASALGDRLFQVFPRASLTLQNLTLTGGHPPDNGHLSYIFPQVGVGGAIYNAGTLVLDHCIVTGNASADYNLYNPIPCGEDGGGIYNTGRLQMVQCLISDNSAGNGWTAYVQDGYYWGWHGVPGGNGGGVYNWFNGVCEFDFCVFSGNKSGDSRGLYPNNANNDNIGGSGGSGGGVCNLGKMTLTGCTISNNMTGFGQSVNNTNASGEAFPNYIGAIGGNGGVGAGIYNSGQLGLKFCSVSSNICGDGGEGGNGGNGTNNGFDVPGGYIVGDVFCRGGIGGEGAGLYNAGSASLDTCTFSGNRTGNGGNGGIGYTLGGDGGYGGRGAAIYNYGPFEIYTSLSFNILPPILVDFVPMTTVLSLSSCTIAGNICGHGGINGIGMSGNGQAGQPGLNGVGGAGGGILNDDTNTAVVVRNTLIASNQTDVYDATTENGLTANGQIANNDVLGPAVAGDFTSQGFNLIGVADDSTGFVNGTNADQVGSAVAPIDPLLGPLQLNGGPTPTLALLPGSPAIDQGKCFGVRIDQRGWARPYKNPRIPDAPGGDGSDIGAYERQSLRNP